jgi:hypothetical protein
MSPSEEQFRKLVSAGDAEDLSAFLDADDATSLVNQPLFSFGRQAIHMVRENLDLVDVLLVFGADINRRSEWEPGGYHILEDTTPEVAAPLMERGAKPDIFAYTSWNDLNAVRSMLDRDPALAGATGGDGVRPLHYAQSVPMAELFLERGADIDARCVDHESTAAQYMIGEHPEVLDFLVAAGAAIDLFLAVALDDVDRVSHNGQG